MTILTIDKKQFEKKVGKMDKEMDNTITMMGTPVESVSDNEISIEVFPNRPDLLSYQGFCRSLLQYLGKKKFAEYNVNKPLKDYVVKIEKPVKSVRPYTACAIVKGLKLDNEKIKEIIDIQEKLHLTLGRKRKKLAIGIYPLEKIKLPIRYTAKKPDEIKFIPLEFDKELTGAQILRQHPTGRDYAFLLEGYDLYPVFIDANNKVLSMPPIINSRETGKIDENTKEVFIECSGSNLVYLKKTINIIASTLADMGGQIYAMEIQDSENFISPDLKPEKIKVNLSDINKTLGLNLNEKDFIKYLQKMGLEYEKGEVLIPAYRADILHWVDIAEEVAIGYGYENFNAELPKISTVGEEDKREVLKNIIREILVGLNLLEVSSFHLAIKDDIKKMNYDFKDFIEIENSKTEYNVLRMDLASNLLKILSENSDSAYPQKMFEIGKVFSLDKSNSNGVEEKERLCVALSHDSVNFTELKSVLDYLFKMLDKSYRLEQFDNFNFIPGRSAKIFVDNFEIGIIGEVAPRVLSNWKLKMPVSAFELNIGFLSL
ncbi:MAG: phenylalanine--tRNA ligase subunit beta [Nanoarchaeota archaeon]|nr:phenylalanine--tRNA ligase subunit beta [Nanoarchaeota archaeon]